MAETVEMYMERMLPELEDLKEKGIFTEEELRVIVERRRGYEYTLARRKPLKHHYLKYIAYELNVDALRASRKKDLAIRKSSVSDFAGHRRIHFIFNRALKRFKGDVPLWLQYIDYCMRTKASKALAKTFPQALQLHPRQEVLWLQAAAWEYDVNRNLENARVYMQRSIRINGDSEKLWMEYFRLELLIVSRMAARRAVLGLAALPPADPRRTAAADTEAPLPPADDSGAGSAESKTDSSNAAKAAYFSGSVPYAIYKQACKGIQGKGEPDPSVRIRMLSIVDSFDTPLPGIKRPADSPERGAFPALAAAIVEDIMTQFPQNAEAWACVATRPVDRLAPLRSVPNTSRVVSWDGEAGDGGSSKSARSTGGFAFAFGDEDEDEEEAPPARRGKRSRAPSIAPQLHEIWERWAEAPGRPEEDELAASDRQQMELAESHSIKVFDRAVTVVRSSQMYNTFAEFLEQRLEITLTPSRGQHKRMTRLADALATLYTRAVGHDASSARLARSSSAAWYALGNSTCALQILRHACAHHGRDEPGVWLALADSIGRQRSQRSLGGKTDMREEEKSDMAIPNIPLPCEGSELRVVRFALDKIHRDASGPLWARLIGATMRAAAETPSSAHTKRARSDTDQASKEHIASVVAVLKECIAAAAPNVEDMRLRSLEWIVARGGIDAVRAYYPVILDGASAASFEKAVDAECAAWAGSSERGSPKATALLFETAVKEHGNESTRLWMQFIEWHMMCGRVADATATHTRAVRELDDPREFITARAKGAGKS